MVASLAHLAVIGGWRLATYPRVAQRVALTPAEAPAPYPPDAVRLPHLFLTPQKAPVPSCQEIADRLGFPAPCPGLLPAEATISGPDCCVFHDHDPNVAPRFVLEYHFRAPAGYPSSELSGDGIPRGHLVIIGQQARAATSAVACSAPTPLDTGPPVAGSPSRWEHCSGPGSNAGHLILEWAAAGIDYSISLHGETPENRAAIVLMVERLTFIPPGNYQAP
ncbi:MAG: hypothetical protein M3Z98_07085 [Candidatus Dormibacteraeota bacterium]|nr:hypothetical protein [Candidatus Dormibacteraeota bacterium]